MSGEETKSRIVTLTSRLSDTEISLDVNALIALISWYITYAPEKLRNAVEYVAHVEKLVLLKRELIALDEKETHVAERKLLEGEHGPEIVDWHDFNTMG